MEDFPATIPIWVDALSLPILLVMLVALDYFAAIWLQPTGVPSQQNGNAKVPEIFKHLLAFSVIGLVCGFILAAIEITPLKTSVFSVALFAFFAWAFLVKKLWVVGGACYASALIIGQVIVNYHPLYAFLLSIAMVSIILIMAITIGPLSFIKTK